MSFILLGILNSQAQGVAAPAFLESAPLWLDASDATTITESSGSVSQWDNKGTLENFTQATSALQPTTGVTTVNGLNVIDFDADFLSGSDASQWKFMHDGTKFFIALVFKDAGNPDRGGILNNTNGSGDGIGYELDIRNSNDFATNSRNGSGVIAVIFDDSYLTATDTIISAFYDVGNATLAERIDYFNNNTQGLEENIVSGAPSTSNPSRNMFIGSVRTNDRFIFGSIGELIVVSGADATETNRQATVDYLNNKWSVF